VSEPWGTLVTMSSCFVICKWNWLFISSLSASLPSYEGLSTQWCSVFYHHRGTQQNDRMCLVGEAANFRKVLVQVHLTCQGFFFGLCTYSWNQPNIPGCQSLQTWRTLKLY
jgi:hypothetical protein